MAELFNKIHEEYARWRALDLNRTQAYLKVKPKSKNATKIASRMEIENEDIKPRILEIRKEMNNDLNMDEYYKNNKIKGTIDRLEKVAMSARSNADKIDVNKTIFAMVMALRNSEIDPDTNGPIKMSEEAIDKEIKSLMKSIGVI